MAKNDKKSASKVSFASTERRKAGEKVAGAETPISFFKKVLEKEDGEVIPTVDIPVKIDPTGGNERSNTSKETFNKLLTFANAGEKLIELRRDLMVKVYKQQGLVTPNKMGLRLRYLGMALGTTAKQQLGKAQSEAFKITCKEQDPNKPANEVETASQNEILIFEWLAKPRQFWDGYKEDPEKQAGFIRDANNRMEDLIWFQLNKLAFPETHSEALNKFDTYIKTMLIKPRAWTITQTLERVEELYDMRKFVPAPGDELETALYDNPRTPFPENTKRQIAFDLLPRDWQTRVKGQLLNWLNEPEPKWIRTLRQVETEVELAQQQAALARKRTRAQSSDEDSFVIVERKNKAKKRAKESSKQRNKSKTRTAKGEAKYCAFCHKIGRSEYAYTSHNEEDCTVKNGQSKFKSDMEKGFSGDRRSKASTQKHYEKTVKDNYEKTLRKQSRQIKEMRKVIKSMGRHSGGREARAAAAKADQDTISSFMNDSESDVSMSDSD